MLFVNGPGVADMREKRRVKMNGRMAATYDSVVRTTNEPTKALKAVDEPT